MKEAPFDFLKLKVSAGVLGYDANTPYFLYANRYYNGNDVAFGQENKTSAGSTNWAIVGNDKLKWEKSQEVSVGIEGMTLNKRLSFEVNYFNELRKDIILKNGIFLFKYLRWIYRIREWWENVQSRSGG